MASKKNYNYFLFFASCCSQMILVNKLNDTLCKEINLKVFFNLAKSKIPNS
jgi:hypothetical protein